MYAREEYSPRVFFFHWTIKIFHDIICDYLWDFSLLARLTYILHLPSISLQGSTTLSTARMEFVDGIERT